MGYISESDFAGNVAFVRDLRGARAALRNIPRGHRVLVIGALTVDPETGQMSSICAGEAEAFIPEGGTEATVRGWSEILRTVLEANDTNFAYQVEDWTDRDVCPFHGRH